jgi:threonine/homoserine/homoserine lactone efflux protein
VSPQVWVIPYAYGLGFLAAIPVGASQVEVVKRSLARRYGAALLTAAGTATSDMVYGFLALFGLARFLDYPVLLVSIQWVGAAILVALCFLTWRQSMKVLLPDEEAAWTGGGISYLTGFVVGISYPPIMLSWLLGVALVKGVVLVDSFHPLMVVSFVLSGGAGLFSYMAVLTLILRRTHHFYSEKTVRFIYRGLSILLGVIALGFFVSGVYRLSSRTSSHRMTRLSNPQGV